MKSKGFLLLLVLLCLLVAGCNEEEKYNTAKSEFLQQQETWRHMHFQNRSDDGSLVIDEDAVAKKESEKSALDEKLKTLEALAKSKTELNNDYLKTKQDWENAKSGWKDALATARTLQKMHEDVIAAGRTFTEADLDPWARSKK